MAIDYLIDTNVLLRALSVANPQKAVARQAIKTLLKEGAELCCPSEPRGILGSVHAA
jgi:hypothetical protein